MIGLYGITMEKAMQKIPLKAIANKAVRIDKGVYCYIDEFGIAKRCDKLSRWISRLDIADIKPYGYPQATLSPKIFQAYTKMFDGNTYQDLILALVENVENSIYYNPGEWHPLLYVIRYSCRILRVDNEKYYGFNADYIWTEYTKQQVINANMLVWAYAFGERKRMQRDIKTFKLFDSYKDNVAEPLEIATLSKLKVGDSDEEYYKIRSQQIIYRRMSREHDAFALTYWLSRNQDLDIVNRLVVTGPIIDVQLLPETMNREVFDYIIIKYRLRTSRKEERNKIIHREIKRFTKDVSNTLKHSWELQRYGIPINMLAIKRIEIQLNDLVYTLALKDNVIKVLEGQ